MEKKTINIVTNELGEDSQFVEFKGFVEKMVLTFPEQADLDDTALTLTITTNDGEVLMERAGDRDGTLYPRTVAVSSEGHVFTAETGNPFPIRFYISKGVTIDITGTKPDKKLTMTFYFRAN